MNAPAAPARPLLDSSRVQPAALARMATFHHEVLATVQAAVEANRVVVVGMAQNPVVKKARAALDEAKITYTYLEYGSYLSEWKPRLAIKLWSGWPTFPQVFVDGVLLGGNAEVRAAIAEGSLAGG